jgi:hypothetical protein
MASAIEFHTEKGNNGSGSRLHIIELAQEVIKTHARVVRVRWCVCVCVCGGVCVRCLVA